MEMTVRRAGLLTTVQDLGRTGHRAAGVPLGGAMDPFALRVANLLVGNPENTPALECTLAGPELVFERDALVAVCGADFGTLPPWQPAWVRAGEPLKLPHARSGCRAYVAVAGGLHIPPVLGSAGTFLRAGFGGWKGRALRDGDILPAGEAQRRLTGSWRADPRILPAYSPDAEVRVVSGAHADQFGPEFFSSEFTVTPQSDRMGLRLAGPKLPRGTEDGIPSAPVAPGTVQVPPDGQPIVLMADAQTIGGYPQLAHVITADLPVVAQLRPGDRVRFRMVPLDEAHALLLARERALQILREGLSLKFA